MFLAKAAAVQRLYDLEISAVESDYVGPLLLAFEDSA